MWLEIGEEQPVKDKHGRRREFDDDGNQVELEFVSYEPLKGVEINIADMTVFDRRFIESVVNDLAERKGSSTMNAVNMEEAFVTCVTRYIKGVKHKEGRKDFTEKEAHRHMFDMCEHEDRIAILVTLRKQSELSASKKKSWNSLFDLPTSSASKG